MPACMLIAPRAKPIDATLAAQAEGSINKVGRLRTRKARDTNVFGAVSFTPHCRLGGDRLFDDGGVCAWFVGYLVDHRRIPWAEIVRALESGDYAFFKTFKAPFAVAAHFRQTGDTFLVSDVCSQFPAFYADTTDTLVISTAFSTFFACLEQKKFNEKWLTDFILFNLPVDDTTPIQGVCRMPAASVLRVDRAGGKSSQTRYAEPYRAMIPNRSEKETKERTYTIFCERIPKYYTLLSAGPYAASATSGFDSRVCISFKPDDVDLQLYTYGLPGCEDMVVGKEIAGALGLRHHALPLDGDRLRALYSLAQKTVERSGGGANALRANLVHVYEQLADLGLEAVITGINGDHYFRSSGVTPHTFSVAAVSLIKDPKYMPLEHPYLSAFKNTEQALEHFRQSVDSLEQRFAWSSIPLSERQLTFAHYELGAKYFGGELSLADNYLAMVSPFWDASIRELSYTSNLSTLTLTPFIYDVFPYWKRHSLFSYILLQHSKLKTLPVHGISPKYYAPGSKAFLLWGKILQKGPRKLLQKFRPPQDTPQEAWDKWLGEFMLQKLPQTTDSLLTAEFISPDVLHNVVSSEIRTDTRGGSFHLGGKILTAELLLRQFHKGRNMEAQW